MGGGVAVREGPGGKYGRVNQIFPLHGGVQEGWRDTSGARKKGEIEGGFSRSKGKS